MSAEEALQIVEMNGGVQYRTYTNNNCSIGITYRANSPEYGWDVSYSSEEPTGIRAWFNIDPYTGKILHRPNLTPPGVEK